MRCNIEFHLTMFDNDVDYKFSLGNTEARKRHRCDAGS